MTSRLKQGSPAASNTSRRCSDSTPCTPGILLLAQGRVDEAIRTTREAQQLDPLAPLIAQDLAWALLYTRQYEDAITEAEKSIALGAQFPPGRMTVGYIYVSLGRYEEGLRELRDLVDQYGTNTEYQGVLGYAYALSGDQVAAREIATRLEELSTPAT